MGKIVKPIHVIDSNGVDWTWDGEFLWVTSELPENTSPSGEFGYYCSSLTEMFDILIRWGYIYF